MRPLASLLGLIMILGLFACGSAPKIHAPPEVHEGTGQLLAGAAKVDITPLPGVPLGGHSLEGGTGLALWTRLWARAIYLEDAAGEPLVLVAVDLWAVPAGLADAVLDRVREHHGLGHIGRAQLLIAATHTHHGPANFSSSRLYNRAASPAMGFDPDLHDFLTRGIAHAIASAATAKAPAQLRLESSTLPLVARNRSAAPFMQNPEAGELLAQNASLPTCPDAPLDAEAGDIDACRAIDPTLTTLRIDDLQGRPLALAAFFAVHATAMINRTHVYNGDLFAVATARAEAGLARARPELGDPVVALFNGPEGDVSPNWDQQGRPATEALGERLGAAIGTTAGLGAGQGQGQGAGQGQGVDEAPAGCGSAISGPIASGFERIALADQEVGGHLSAPPGARTAARPLPGKALLGGAEDGRTRFHQRLPEGQTVQRHRRPGQGPKKPVVPPALFTMLFPGSMVPREVPISVHRIGPLTLAGLPGEFSTIMGMRVRSTLAAHASPGAPRPVLIGLASEYLSYFVTPQEYALQHYEGGSTLWGQYAGTLIAIRHGELAATVQRGEAAEAVSTVADPRAPFVPGSVRHFALRPGARTRRALAKLDAHLHELLAIPTPTEQLPRLRLEAGAPSWDRSSATWPLVSVELGDGPGNWRTLVREGVAVDERTTQFVMFPVEIDRARWRWEIWWIGELPGGATLRLHAFAPDGSEHCSQPFEAGALAAPEAVACAHHHEPVADPREGLGVVPG